MKSCRTQWLGPELVVVLSNFEKHPHPLTQVRALNSNLKCVLFELMQQGESAGLNAAEDEGDAKPHHTGKTWPVE